MSMENKFNVGFDTEQYRNDLAKKVKELRKGSDEETIFEGPP
jgi:hypothetical protein